jgi:hypothetical protein
MNGMKRLAILAFFPVLALIAIAPCILAQTSTGTVEFVARITPASGVEEPVRGMPFYLLSRSFQDIGKEAAANYPKPDMDTFIDKLGVSKELKAWMKKNHTVTLSGEDLINKLKVPDVMDIPEFYDAYMRRNAGDEAFNFPKPKFKVTDKTKDPAKYEKLSKEYNEAVRKFMTDNPQSMDGMDLNLVKVDPSQKWEELSKKRTPEIQRQTLDVAQSRYLVARAQTDLEGQGLLRGIAPGTYWLTTLAVTASVGDARLQWDVPVAVRAGATASVALTNSNAIKPPHSSQ